MKDTELPAELQALLPEFIAETRDYLDAAEKTLSVLKQNPTDSESQKNLFRLFHTIKGTAGFFHLNRLDKLVHASEDTIRYAQKQGFSPSLIALMRETIDRARFIIDRIEHPNLSGPNTDEELIIRLTKNPGCENPSPEEHIQEAIETAPSPQGLSPLTQTATENGSASKIKEKHTLSQHIVRVPEYLLDQLMSLSSELIPTYNQIEEWARDSKSTGLHNLARKLSVITKNLRDTVLKTRLQSIRIGWKDLPDKIKNLAHELHKDIILEIEDHDLKMDRYIIETLKGPLTHIIRNALDHGIEPPEERLKHKKPKQGKLHLSARQEGAYVIITIADDGRGLNIPHIRQKAEQLMLYDKETLNSMSDDAIMLLLFTPGFSTKETISKISGRGVGLDTAREYITALGGNITISSKPGFSTTVMIVLPLTFATTKMLMIRVRDFVFALPQNRIQEILLLPQYEVFKTQKFPDILWHGDHPFIRWQKQQVPIVSLAPFLKLDNTPQSHWESASLIILSPPGYMPFCLLVDRILHSEELLIKALPKFLGLPPVFSGQSLMADGSPILVLDATSIAQLSTIKPIHESHPLKQQSSETFQIKSFLGVSLKDENGDLAHKLLPLDSVVRIETLIPEHMHKKDDCLSILYRGEELPVVFCTKNHSRTDNKKPYPFIILTDGHHIAALWVEHIFGFISPNQSVNNDSLIYIRKDGKDWDVINIKDLLADLPLSELSLEKLGLSPSTLKDF